MTTSDTISAQTKQVRFTDDILSMHSKLRFGALLQEIEGEPLCRLSGLGDGLTTITVRQSQIPDRYLRGILGFRLSQFLRSGLMSVDVAYLNGLAHEPMVETAETIHTITMTESGEIIGYIGCVASADLVPVPLDGAGRRHFPAEFAHRIDLVSPLASSELRTDHVFEIKRFTRSSLILDPQLGAKACWHLLLSLGKTIVAPDSMIKIILGDSRESRALRYLRLIGFEPTVINGTKPSLPRTDLMWPSYEQEKLVKPFIAHVPTDFANFLEVVESGLWSEDSEWQRNMARGLRSLRVAKAAL
jgi:hypothetical protein